MKSAVALILVVVALASAEPPRFGGAPQRQSAPYAPRGWRPDGPSFELPQRQQVYAPPVSAPQTIYGAPQQQQQQQNYLPPKVEYGPPEPDIINVETTTAIEELPATQTPAKLVEELDNSKLKPEKLEEKKPQSPVFLIVPQPEKLVYTVQQSAPLFAVPQTKVLANLQSIPLGQAALATSYYTPTFSSSYVQIYQ